MGAVRTILAQEWRDTRHNRWLIGFGVLFAGLTVGISYFGMAGAREVGFQGFQSVSASLLNLILFTVPLLALLHPASSLTSPHEGLLILLTQPVSRWEVLVGKYLGMLASLSATMVGGLAVGGAVVAVQTGGEHVGDFALLAGLSLVLIAILLAVGIAGAMLAGDRAKALSLGLGIWFALVVLYDLVVFGLTISGPGLPLRVFLVSALLLNPVDAVRVCYLLVSDNSAFVGVTGAVLAETLGHPAGVAVLVVDFGVLAAAALGLAAAVFGRRDF